jgi:hypothetical protein
MNKDVETELNKIIAHCVEVSTRALVNKNEDVIAAMNNVVDAVGEMLEDNKNKK